MKGGGYAGAGISGPDNFDCYFKDSHWPGNTLFMEKNFRCPRVDFHTKNTYTRFTHFSPAPPEKKLPFRIK
jgi:hypothetical protein